MIEMVKFRDIALERLTLAHAEDVYAMVSESITELLPWMDWVYSGYGIEDTIEWLANADDAWEKKEEYHFLIKDISRHHPVGVCGLGYTGKKKKVAILGYWIRSSEAGKGIATAAAGLAVKFAFKDMGCSRVEIMADVSNEASIRVIEKIGGVKEGILRKRLMTHGEERDAVLYSILRGE